MLNSTKTLGELQQNAQRQLWRNHLYRVVPATAVVNLEVVDASVAVREGI